MQRILLKTLILACLTVSCSGCAGIMADDLWTSAIAKGISYTPKTVPIPVMESAAVSREEAGLQVAVNPYTNTEKTMEIFDANLTKARILALHVLVKNKGHQQITLHTNDFILHLSTGKEYTPTPALEAAMHINNSAGAGWYFFGRVGHRNIQWAYDQVNTHRRADFRRKEFQDAPLGPGQAAHGFLFYLIPDDVHDLRNASLLVKGTDDVQAASILVELPLGDLGAW